MKSHFAARAAYYAVVYTQKEAQNIVQLTFMADLVNEPHEDELCNL